MGAEGFGEGQGGARIDACPPGVKRWPGLAHRGGQRWLLTFPTASANFDARLAHLSLGKAGGPGGTFCPGGRGCGRRGVAQEKKAMELPSFNVGTVQSWLREKKRSGEALI